MDKLNLTLKIEDLGADGEGVAKLEGMVYFVENATIGDVVQIKLFTKHKSYCRGEAVKLVEPSPFRVTPVCESAAECGGCPLACLDYQKQIEWKRIYVQNTLRKIGGVDLEAERVVGMENPYKYRNKAQFPLRVVDGKPTVCFYRKNSHTPLAVRDCAVVQGDCADIIKLFNEYMRENGLRVYGERTGEGGLRHLIARSSQFDGKALICAVTSEDELPYAEKLLAKFDPLERVKTVCANFNRQKSNVILGNETKILSGDGFLTEQMFGLEFRVSPTSFFQVNTAQAERLYGLALDFAAEGTGGVIVDAYCGTGTIALIFAKKFGESTKIIGIESNGAAVADARKNAEINGLRAEFVLGKAEDEIGQLGKIDVVIVDPPRKGLHSDFVRVLLEKSVEKIVYVSCNPATLARDLALLREKYVPIRMAIVDMFPHTSHAETVVLLVKK